MGFWFSKSFAFGPFRISAGTGGLGISFGFGGLRIGLNRWGPYLSFSKGGLYFRKYLTGRRESGPAD